MFVTLLTLLLIILASYFIYWEIELIVNRNAPFVGTPHTVIPQIIKAMNLQHDSVLYDLGCGDSRIIFAALKVFPDIKVVGVDNSFSAIFLSRIKAFIAKFRNKNLTIIKGDYNKLTYIDATHIFAWASTPGITKLRAKLKAQRYINDHVTLFSLDFRVSDTTPSESVILGNGNSNFGHSLHVYKIK